MNSLRGNAVAAAILARKSAAVCGATFMIDLAERGLVKFNVTEDNGVTARRLHNTSEEDSSDVDALKLMFPYVGHEYQLKPGFDLGAGLTANIVVEGYVVDVLRQELFSKGYLRAKGRRKGLLACIVMAVALLFGAGLSDGGIATGTAFVTAVIIVAIAAAIMASRDAERPTPKGASLLQDCHDEVAVCVNSNRHMAMRIPFGTSSEHAHRLEDATWLNRPEGMSSQEAFRKVMDHLVVMLR